MREISLKYWERRMVDAVERLPERERLVRLADAVLKLEAITLEPRPESPAPQSDLGLVLLELRRRASMKTPVKRKKT